MTGCSGHWVQILKKLKEERIASMRKFKRKQKKQLAIVTVIILIASIAAIMLLTPGFNIKKINVTGNSVIKEAEIIRSSGITTGVNIFDISLKKARENILSIGYVESAKVKRKLPSTIEISIVEEVGVAYIKAEDGYVIITADGRCIDITDGIIKNDDSGTESVQLPDLPIITGLDKVKYKVGKTITSENTQQLEALFNCLHEFSKQNHIFNIKEINMSDITNIRFYYLNRELSVIVGDTEKLGYKMEAFGTAIDQIITEETPNPKGTVDLSRVGTLEKVTYRPPETEKTE